MLTCLRSLLTIKTKIKQSLVSSIINQKYSKQSKTSFCQVVKLNFHKFIYVFLPSVLFLEHMELLVVQVLPPSQYHPTTYNSERKFPIVKVKSLKIKRVSIFSGNPRLRMRFPANFLCRHSIHQDTKLLVPVVYFAELVKTGLWSA